VPADRVKINVTRPVPTIGQGIMKLPYETAVPLLTELQLQLEGPKAEVPAAKPEDKPAKT
jgi:hypothetical protein